MDFYSFDADYLRRLQARDAATEAHFASYFGKGLQIRLRSLGFASASLEDISQETFYQVLREVQNGTVLYPERLGAYVSSVCDRVILKKYHEHARNQHLDVDGMEQEKTKIVGGILIKLPPKKRTILHALIFRLLDRNGLGRLTANPAKSEPPRCAEFLLLLIPKNDREHLLGDLEEEFRTIVLPRHGKTKAYLWYWWHTLITLFPYVRQFAKRALGMAVLLKLIGK